MFETWQELYDRGVRGWKFQEFESQFLEEYDPMKAIARLEGFIQQEATPANHEARHTLGRSKAGIAKSNSHQ